MPRDRKSPPESFLRFYRPIFAFWHARLQGDRPSHRKNDGASCVFARPTIPTVSRGACWPPATEIYIWGNVTPHAADKDISGYRPPDVLYSIGLKFPSRKGMKKRSACKISIRAKWWPKRLGRSPAFIKTGRFTPVDMIQPSRRLMIRNQKINAKDTSSSRSIFLRGKWPKRLGRSPIFINTALFTSVDRI